VNAVVLIFLLDEMLPPHAATILRDEHALRAEHVTELGMAHTEDAAIAQFAREHTRVVVTENVADFAVERGVVLVFVLRRNLPPGGAMASGLAERLARWAAANTDPFPGQHWLR
jgi:hypothetical protein